jgi:hypothetical protein
MKPPSMESGYYCVIAIVLIHLCSPSPAVCQDTNRFMIFGEFLNHGTLWAPEPPNGFNQCRWNSIGDSLRLNMGVVKIHMQDPDVNPAGLDTNEVKTWFDGAYAHNNMKLLVLDDHDLVLYDSKSI